MLLDGDVKYTGKAQTGVFFQFPFKLEGHAFCVVQTESEWDLKIDNLSFSRLKMNQQYRRSTWDTDLQNTEELSIRTDPGFRPHPGFTSSNIEETLGASFARSATLRPHQSFSASNTEETRTNPAARVRTITDTRLEDSKEYRSLPRSVASVQKEVDLLDLSGPTQAPPTIGSRGPDVTFSSRDGLLDMDFPMPTQSAPQNNPFLAPANPVRGGFQPVQLRPAPMAHPYSAALLMHAYTSQMHRSGLK